MGMAVDPVLEVLDEFEREETIKSEITWSRIENFPEFYKDFSSKNDRYGQMMRALDNLIEEIIIFSDYLGDKGVLQVLSRSDKDIAVIDISIGGRWFYKYFGDDRIRDPYDMDTDQGMKNLYRCYIDNLRFLVAYDITEDEKLYRLMRLGYREMPESSLI